MIQNAPIVNALSFDIEDWFHMVEIDAVSEPETWEWNNAYVWSSQAIRP